MRAWQLHEWSGLDALRLEETSDPAPAPGQVVLDVELAALNPADRYLSQGQYPARPALPHILGRDGIGMVSAIGPNVSSVRVGDVRIVLRSAVGVSLPGTLAQRVAVPVESLAHVPEGWTREQAAAAPLVYLTAYQALMHWGDLPPGVVLVTGASGGVGVAGIQLGKALGHTLVALSRDAAKRQQLLDLGADHALDPQDPDWAQQLKQTLAPRRVDLAIDNIGGPLFGQVIDTLGEHGRVSIVGALAGPVPQFSTPSLLFRRLRIGGVAVGAYTPDESQAAWQQIVQLLECSGARPIIDSVFAFEDLIPAFEKLARGPMGKVLVRIGQ